LILLEIARSHNRLESKQSVFRKHCYQTHKNHEFQDGQITLAFDHKSVTVLYQRTTEKMGRTAAMTRALVFTCMIAHLTGSPASHPAQEAT